MRKVKWSKRAQLDRILIFTYWNNNNKSSAYSKKLRGEFKTATSLLKIFPELSTSTNISNIRMKLVRDYWIIYKYSHTTIEILSVRNTNQKPKSFYKRDT